MKEQEVTFETSRLAKEKGFSERTNSFYNFESLIETFNDGEMHSNDDFSTEWMMEDYPNAISAPTQSLLQRWLREFHKKIVMVKFCCDGDDFEDVRYWVDVSEFEHFKTHDSFVSNKFASYEEALEKGLFEALKLIK